MAPREPEPRLLKELEAFEEGDFHALSEGLCSDPQYDDRRLVARRKLGTIAKSALTAIAASSGGELKLASRSSLHRPHTFNGKRVRRLWAYMTRDKSEKTRLRKVLGSDLAKDLDAAYRNAYLCVALEAECIETSLRIHPDGWYDGQNLVNRTKREGTGAWLERLNELDGYFLRMANWKGEWRCGELTEDRLREFLSYYTPGDHALSVERRFPAPKGARGVALDGSVPSRLVAELTRLVPLYRYTAWSKESDFLFGDST